MINMKNFIKKYLSFHRFWCKSITKNKTIELEVFTTQFFFNNILYFTISKDRISFCFNILNSLFGINFKIDWKCDHAGVEFQLTLLGTSHGFYLYDNRHWDYKNNKWEEYDTD